MRTRFLLIFHFHPLRRELLDSVQFASWDRPQTKWCVMALCDHREFIKKSSGCFFLLAIPELGEVLHSISPNYGEVDWTAIRVFVFFLCLKLYICCSYSTPRMPLERVLYGVICWLVIWIILDNRKNLKYGTGHPMKMPKSQSLYKSWFFSSCLVLGLEHSLRIKWPVQNPSK